MQHLEQTIIAFDLFITEYYSILWHLQHLEQNITALNCMLPTLLAIIYLINAKRMQPVCDLCLLDHVRTILAYFHIIL